jgi:hypothetical protein
LAAIYRLLLGSLVVGLFLGGTGLEPLQALGGQLEGGRELKRLAEVGDGAGRIAAVFAQQPACSKGARGMRVERKRSLDIG